MKRRILSVFILLAAIFVINISKAASLDEAISKLSSEIKSVSIDDWKYHVGDIPGAENPNFDDSSWKTVDPEFDWGPAEVCWFRKTITIPESIGGIPIAGGAVYFVAGIDDSGTCYVNGKKMQEFEWDKCRVLLTENAIPGEKFLIAIRGINGPGGGRIMFARLDSQILEDWRNKTSAVQSDITIAKQLIELEKDAQKKQLYTELLAKANDAIDVDAILNKDLDAFTKSLEQFYSILEPMQQDIKEYTAHLIGHAHIDMNWLWLWPETIDVCKNTFSTMLNLLNTYPDFRFSQSQASTYIIMEQLYPEIFKQIQEKVKEGKWEITGGTWVEGDMNMASGESITRQLMYARRYFKEKFNVESEIAWEPDTFGHAWSVPQILAKSGIKYYYFCRCGKDQRVFWWQSPDGSRVLAYNFGWYSDTINDRIYNYPFEIARRYGVKDGMSVYGVGDHGGGPTIKDIEKAKELQRRELFPTVKFNFARDFYETLLSKKTDWPTIDDELNFVFQGCYTSHSDIKKMNRISESLLPEAEAFSALAMMYGYKYPQSDFVEAWRNTCFNQFHDIFDGTAIHGSYEHSRELFEDATKRANNALDSSLKIIERNIDTNGNGIPVVVFNQLSWNRDDVVTVDIPASLQGKNITVKDSNGKSMPSQVVDGRVSFTAKSVPSLGYKTFYLTGNTKSTQTVMPTDYIIENEFLTVSVDPTSGTITSIYDKKAKKEVVANGGNASLLQILMESPHGMSAWDIGKITKTIDLNKAESVKMLENGKQRKVIRVTHKFNNSSFSQDITLYAGVPRIDIKFTADWQEKGGPDVDAPFLKVAFPVDVTDGKACFEIPFASIERPANGDEVPSQKWMDLSGENYGVSILNDCKYGHDINGNRMRLSLLRSSYEPDPIPDVGQHSVTYSIYPHQGDWRKADTVRRGYELNNPLIPIISTNHDGDLPSSHSYLRIDSPNLVVTALKKAEDSNDMILRFYECKGEPGKAKITFGMNVKSIQETDLVERPGDNPIQQITGNSCMVQFGKWEIKAFKLSVD